MTFKEWCRDHYLDLNNLFSNIFGETKTLMSRVEELERLLECAFEEGVKVGRGERLYQRIIHDEESEERLRIEGER